MAESMTMLDCEDVALSAEVYTEPCQTSIMKLLDIVLCVGIITRYL